MPSNWEEANQGEGLTVSLSVSLEAYDAIFHPRHLPMISPSGKEIQALSRGAILRRMASIPSRRHVK